MTSNSDNYATGGRATRLSIKGVDIVGNLLERKSLYKLMY